MDRMPISDWPQQERPREKLRERGPGSLSDAELLAIFLGSGVRGKSALDVARGLLSAYGGLRGILRAEAEELCSQPGVGPSKYVLLQASLELAQRHLYECLRRED